MSSDRLRGEIESLLRGHWRHALAPRPPRLPVLGDLSVATASGWAPGWTIPHPGWVVEPTGLRIEPGLLCLSGPRADITYPFLLEMPSWLSAWAAGTGIDVPDSAPPRDTLLLGELTEATNRVPPIDWPDGDDWQGRLYASAAALNSVLRTETMGAWIATPAGPYTGGGRLIAEACLASGRAIGEWLPTLCASAPGALGLIWSEPVLGIPTAWVLDIDSVGLWGWQMVHSPLTEPLLLALTDGTLTGNAAHLAWLYVIAGLTPVGGSSASPTVILDGEGMAPAYANGGPLHMAGWGWPEYDSGVLACATVTGGIFDTGLLTQGYESRLCRVNITADGTDEPSAVLITGALARWRPWWGYHKMWCGEASDLYLLRHGQIFPGSSDCAAAAPVCCMWEGTLLRQWNYYKGESTPTTTFEGDTLTGTWSIMQGGYGWESPPARLVGSGTRTSKLVIPGNDGSMQELARQRSGDPTCCTGACRAAYAGMTAPWAQKATWDSAMVGGTGNTALDIFTNLNAGETQPQYATRVWGASAPAMGQWSNPPWHFILMGTYASVESKKSVATISSSAYGQICVYLHGTPDAIWNGQGTQTNLTGTVRNTWTRTALSSVRSDIERCDWVYGWNPSYYEMYPYERANAVQIARANLGYSESGTATSSSSGSATEGDWSASLRLAGHDYAAGDASDWQALDANGLLPPYQIGIGAKVSARGSAAWQAVPWSAWDSDTGLPGAKLEIAQSWAGG